MNEVVTAIATVGFPIVACLLIGWYVKYSGDKYQKQIDDMQIRHSQEMEKVTEALNNNTLAIQKLCDKLGE